eukprot:92049_1
MDTHDIDDAFIQKSQSEESQTVYESLRSSSLWRLAIYGLSIAFASSMTNIVMPQIGASYFHDDNNDSDCTSGNAHYAYYSGIMNSIGGILAFIFEGYLGRLSDVYGRKKLLYVTWSCFFIGNFLMIFTTNIWVYLCSVPLQSICGAMGGSPTVMQAAFADAIPCKTNRTIIFSILFGVGGIVVLLSALITPLITNYFGLRIVFWVFSVVMVVDLLWLILGVRETLPALKRVTNKAKYDNPFKILKEINSNRILFWFSMATLILSIPESGLNDIMTNYSDQMLHVCSSSKLTTYNAVFTASLGIAMLISQLGCMPLLTRCVSDIGLLIIGLIVLQIMMFCSALLYFVPGIMIAVVLFAAFGTSYILSPIIDGSLSKRLSDEDQGIGIGVIHGVKGITSAFAPYVFGGLYDLFDNYTWFVITPFIVGACIGFVGLVVIMGPLRKTINHFDEIQIKSAKVPVNQ